MISIKIYITILYIMPNNFFLDIFNKILKINDDTIIIIFDVNNNVWFKF